MQGAVWSDSSDAGLCEGSVEMVYCVHYNVSLASSYQGKDLVPQTLKCTTPGMEPALHNIGFTFIAAWCCRASLNLKQYCKCLTEHAGDWAESGLY